MPADLLVRAAPPREARPVKTRDREADLMARMEKSMLKAAVRDEEERARLPKPKEILQEAVGPALRVEAQAGNTTIIKERPIASDTTLETSRASHAWP